MHCATLHRHPIQQRGNASCTVGISLRDQRVPEENRPIQPTSTGSDQTPLLARRWMHRAVAWGRRATLCVLVLLLAACDGDSHLTFLNPQGPVADAQRWHFYEVLGIMTVLVAGPIFLLLPFFAWRYRYGNTASRYTPEWGFTRLFEITAWGGPIVIVAVLAFFVWRDAHRLDPYKPLASDQAQLRVQVDRIRLEMAVHLSRPGHRQHRHAGHTGRTPGVHAYNLRHGDAVVVHPGVGQPDLCHGRHGHAAKSGGRQAWALHGRKHHVQRRRLSPGAFHHGRHDIG